MITFSSLATKIMAQHVNTPSTWSRLCTPSHCTVKTLAVCGRKRKEEREERHCTSLTKQCTILNMHLQVLRMSTLAERLRLGSKSARRGAMVCVRLTIRGSKNVPVYRNPSVCVCVCVRRGREK